MHRFLNMILDSIFLLMTSGAKDTWWCRSLFKQEGRWLINETACVLLNLNLQVLHFAQTPLSRWENQSNLQIYTRKTTNVSKNLRKRIWKEFFYVILTNFFMRAGFVTARARRFCCNYDVEFTLNFSILRLFYDLFGRYIFILTRFFLVFLPGYREAKSQQTLEFPGRIRNWLEERKIQQRTYE